MNKNSVLVFIGSPFAPDGRVLQESLSLIKNGYKVYIIAWDRDVVSLINKVIIFGKGENQTRIKFACEKNENPPKGRAIELQFGKYRD